MSALKYGHGLNLIEIYAISAEYSWGIRSFTASIKIVQARVIFIFVESSQG